MNPLKAARWAAYSRSPHFDRRPPSRSAAYLYLAARSNRLGVNSQNGLTAATSFPVAASRAFLLAVTRAQPPPTSSSWLAVPSTV